MTIFRSVEFDEKFCMHGFQFVIFLLFQKCDGPVVEVVSESPDHTPGSPSRIEMEIVGDFGDQRE